MENAQPLVSVIIPMYNVEKYIAECLDSLLAQTFKNFEVIVVDNCSTDKSCEIVESYLPKFAQKIQLLHMETPSDYGSLPRNKGLKVAQGKYVFFMDSDDYIISKTLETLYSIAEETQAEVLIAKKFFESVGEGENFLKGIKLANAEQNDDFEYLIPDLKARTAFWINDNDIPVTPWTKFLRRDFLLENKIEFLPVLQQDSLWTFEILCLSKNILLHPYIYYIYRQHQNSVFSRAYTNELSPQSMYRKFDRVINGLKHVDEFMGKIEFFQKNLDYRYAVIDHIVTQNLTWLLILYGKYSPVLVYENLREAFTKETGQFDVLIAYLVSNLIDRITNFHVVEDELAELKKTLKK